MGRIELTDELIDFIDNGDEDEVEEYFDRLWEEGGRPVDEDGYPIHPLEWEDDD